MMHNPRILADVDATKKLLLAPVATSYPMRNGVEVMPPLPRPTCWSAAHGDSGISLLA
jgi:hypothetical protein